MDADSDGRTALQNPTLPIVANGNTIAVHVWFE